MDQIDHGVTVPFDGSMKRGSGGLFLIGMMLGACVTVAQTPASAPPPPALNSSGQGDFIIRPLMQASLGYYSVLLPPDYDAAAPKTYPLCVLLHGSSATETEYGDLVAKSLKRDGVIYLTPRAPYPHNAEFVYAKKPGYTAWPEYGYDWSTIKVAKDAQPDSIAVEKLYTDWIAKCVADARTHYRVREGKVVVFGHSQGASFGFLFAVDHPDLVKACFLADGYYSSRLRDDLAGATLKENGIHLVIVHNEDDPTVKFEEATSLVAYLKKNHVDFTNTFYPTGKHSMTDPIKQQAADFVASECRETAR
jgi:predicted esterase